MRIKTVANKRSIKCRYAPISSGQVVFVETFENFKYIYREIGTGSR